MSMQFKLGKKDFVEDKRDFKLARYMPEVKGVLPTVPESFGHYDLIGNNAWGMDGNDTVGNCVFAGGDHETLLWTTEGGHQAAFSAETAIADYSAVTGYNPSNPDSDQGTVVRDALKYRQKTGLIDVNSKRHKIGAYVSIDPTKVDSKGRPYELMNATYLFSAVGIGIQFPASAMDQFNQGKPWTVVKGSKIEGGHYVCVIGFDGTYFLVVTWGKLQLVSIEFMLKYCDEAWALLSSEFINNSGVSPEGFNYTTLQTDLANITEKPSPTPSPTPTPTPTDYKSILKAVVKLVRPFPKPDQYANTMAQIQDLVNTKNN